MLQIISLLWLSRPTNPSCMFSYILLLSTKLIVSQNNCSPDQTISWNYPQGFCSSTCILQSVRVHLIVHVTFILCPDFHLVLFTDIKPHFDLNQPPSQDENILFHISATTVPSMPDFINTGTGNTAQQSCPDRNMKAAAIPFLAVVCYVTFI